MDKIETLKTLISADTQNSRLHYLLALEYMEAGHDDLAEGSFQEALRYADLSLSQEILEKIGDMNAKAKSSNASSSAGDLVADSGQSSNSALQEDAAADQMVQQQTENAEESEEGATEEKLKVIEGGKVIQMPTIEPEPNQVRFADVGGLDALKKSITMKIIKPFTDPGLFKQFRKKSGGGILLYGPPGCGKTFIARATAGECAASFIPVHISDILDPYFGQSAINVREIFFTARAKRPCVLFFDEIDTLGYSRSKSPSDMLRSVVDQLLTEIEGVDSDMEHILIMAATNTPWDVDTAFRRPGRFDKSIFVAPPDQAAREVIFQLKLADRPVGKVNLRKLAEATALYSGADIENVVEAAAEAVLNEIMETGNTSRLIENDDLFAVVSATRPSTIEWIKTVANYVKFSNQGGFYDEVETFLKENKRYL